MKHYKRGFLNEEKGMAAFEIDIETSDNWNSTGIPSYASAHICLSDCSRKIHLEFDVGSVEDAARIKKKVFSLLQVVQEFHDKLNEAIDTLQFKEKESE